MPSSRRASEALVAAVCALMLRAAPACTTHSGAPDRALDARIGRAEAVVARHPRHYPAEADLALAYLDKARRTLAPDWVAKARAAAHRSLEIQANHEAFKVLAAIEGFAHRFDASLRWAEQAHQSLPEDTEVTCRMVEALLGLGRVGDARRLLPGDAADAIGFHTVAAFALVARAEGTAEPAAGAFQRAAAIAAAQQSPALAAWGRVMAASVWLQRGDTAQASQSLERAALIDPHSPLVRLHRAELLAATNRREEAAALYAQTLRGNPDAEGFRRAMALARTLRDRVRAREYRDAAERMLLPARAAGEVYTLGELARLYRDAGDLERAEALAVENLRYVRDAEAVATLDSTRAALLRAPALPPR